MFVKIFRLALVLATEKQSTEHYYYSLCDKNLLLNSMKKLFKVQFIATIVCIKNLIGSQEKKCFVCCSGMFPFTTAQGSSYIFITIVSL